MKQKGSWQESQRLWVYHRMMYFTFLSSRSQHGVVFSFDSRTVFVFGARVLKADDGSWCRCWILLLGGKLVDDDRQECPTVYNQRIAQGPLFTLSQYCDCCY